MVAHLCETSDPTLGCAIGSGSAPCAELVDSFTRLRHISLGCRRIVEVSTICLKSTNIVSIRWRVDKRLPEEIAAAPDCLVFAHNMCQNSRLHSTLRGVSRDFRELLVVVYCFVVGLGAYVLIRRKEARYQANCTQALAAHALEPLTALGLVFRQAPPQIPRHGPLLTSVMPGHGDGDGGRERR